MSDSCAELAPTRDELNAAGLMAASASLQSLSGLCTRPLDLFLESITDRLWSPRIVIVDVSPGIKGCVLLKERKVGRFSSGLLYGDSMLASMVVAQVEHRKAVLEAALGFLLDARTGWAFFRSGSLRPSYIVGYQIASRRIVLRSMRAFISQFWQL